MSRATSARSARAAAGRGRRGAVHGVRLVARLISARGRRGPADLTLCGGLDEAGRSRCCTGCTTSSCRRTSEGSRSGSRPRYIDSGAPRLSAHRPSTASAHGSSTTSARSAARPPTHAPAPSGAGDIQVPTAPGSASSSIRTRCSASRLAWRARAGRRTRRRDTPDMIRWVQPQEGLNAEHDPKCAKGSKAGCFIGGESCIVVRCRRARVEGGGRGRCARREAIAGTSPPRRGRAVARPGPEVSIDRPGSMHEHHQADRRWGGLARAPDEPGREPPPAFRPCVSRPRRRSRSGAAPGGRAWLLTSPVRASTAPPR